MVYTILPVMSRKMIRLMWEVIDLEKQKLEE